MEKRVAPMRTVLSVVVGIAIAVTLFALIVILPGPATTTLTWSGPVVFHGVGPRGVGSGGPEGPTNCTVLHVEFNGSGPVDSWVAAGNAVVYQNGTISQDWAAAGPASAGGFVVQIPPSMTGYRVVLFNPSLSVMIPSMQFEFAVSAC